MNKDLTHTLALTGALRRLMLTALGLVACCSLLTSCGGDALEKAVKDAYLKGDTTQARYESLCGIIKADTRAYAQYIGPDGQVSAQALQELVTEVGQGLRPPMRWDVTRYDAASQASLTIYFERSGSMVPYDSKSGGGQLKRAVGDLINTFPAGADKVSIKIVNDNIYPYSGTVDSFLQDRDIYATTRGTGDAAYTDFKLIFEKIFSSQRPGNVSVLVTDLIYSPRDTKAVSTGKILNEESSLATSIFRRYGGKSVIVQQLMGDYDGTYYPYNGQPFAYSGQRPFYLIVIADAATLDRMAADPAYEQFLHPQGVRASYRFNQAETPMAHRLLPQWQGDAGRFRPSRDEQDVLTGCKGDKETGVLSFSVAVNLAGLQKSEQFLTDARNYEVQSQNGFTLQVAPIAQSDVKNSNRAALEGMTHVITLSGKFATTGDQVTVRLRNDFPEWIAQSSSADDSNPSAPGFGTTTFGLEQFLRGIHNAFAAGQRNYSTLTITLK